MPIKKEVIDVLTLNGFEVVETKMRNEIIDEPERVKDFSQECRFCVAKKI